MDLSLCRSAMALDQYSWTRKIFETQNITLPFASPQRTLFVLRFITSTSNDAVGSHDCFHFTSTDQDDDFKVIWILKNPLICLKFELKEYRGKAKKQV